MWTHFTPAREPTLNVLIMQIIEWCDTHAIWLKKATVRLLENTTPRRRSGSKPNGKSHCVSRGLGWAGRLLPGSDNAEPADGAVAALPDERFDEDELREDLANHDVTDV